MLNAIAPGRANAINPNKIPTTPRATTHPQRDASPTPSPSLDASMIHLPPYPEVSAARRRSILVTPDSASSAHRAAALGRGRPRPQRQDRAPTALRAGGKHNVHGASTTALHFARRLQMSDQNRSRPLDQ